MSRRRIIELSDNDFVGPLPAPGDVIRAMRPNEARAFEEFLAKRSTSASPASTRLAQVEERAAQATRRLEELKRGMRTYAEAFVDDAIGRGVLPAGERESVLNVFCNEPAKARAYVERLELEIEDEAHAREFERLYGEKRLI